MFNLLLLTLCMYVGGADKSDKQYEVLAKAQNVRAYQRAEERAQTGVGSYRTSMESTSYGVVRRGRHGRGRAANTGRQVQRVVTRSVYFPGVGYGGGPVTVLNPFVPPKN